MEGSEDCSKMTLFCISTRRTQLSMNDFNSAERPEGVLLMAIS